MLDNKLNDPNYSDWVRVLRSALKIDKLLYVLDNPIPDEPSADVDQAVKHAYDKHLVDSEVACHIILSSMISKLQQQREEISAYKIYQHVKALCELFHKKIEEGSLVMDHVF